MLAAVLAVSELEGAPLCQCDAGGHVHDFEPQLGHFLSPGHFSGGFTVGSHRTAGEGGGGGCGAGAGPGGAGGGFVFAQITAQFSRAGPWC